MDNRIVKYFDENVEMVETRIEEVKEKIAAEIEKKQPAFLKDFQDSFNRVFEKTAKMQATGKKSAIAYVCISILRSSVLTKTYQLRIDIYGNNLYLDMAECEGYWDVGFVFQWLNDDKEYFTKCARKKLVRIKDAEMMVFMQYYQEWYFDRLEDLCTEYVAELLDLPSWKKLKKEEEVKFTYGEFLDKGVILHIENNEIYEGAD